MPGELRLVCYGDDVVGLKSTDEQSPSRFGMLMRWVSRNPNMRPISIGNLTIESTPALKYLGLTLNVKMSFFDEIKAAVDKTATRLYTLSWLMANLGGPTSIRTRLFIICK